MNPKLKRAEERLRQEEQAQKLAEMCENDWREIEGVAFSGFKVPLDITYALCRECVRLRRELENLKKRMRSP